MFAAREDVFIPLRETEVFLDQKNASRLWNDLRQEAIKSRKPHLVEKTPRHLRALPLIRALVPKPRFIAMMRDGRDVAASFIKRWGDANVGRKRWIDDNSILHAEQDASDLYILRYEDLIAEPESASRSVCDFAGLPFDPAMLQFHEKERLWFDVKSVARGDGRDGAEHRMLRNWQINQPIFDGRGQWKDKLSQAEVQAFQDPDANMLMKHFGYL
jgi:hypothetical protein